MKGTTMSNNTDKLIDLMSQPTTSTTKTKATEAPKAGDNKVKTAKATFLAIVTLMEERKTIGEEISDEIEILEKEHGIEKKVARAVAALMFKNNKEENDEFKSKVDAIYNKLA